MAKTNWGAGLQALGQSLAGLAELQYQKQQEQAERARQDELLAAERQWQLDRDAAAAAEWDRRNPKMKLPPSMVNLSLPLGQEPANNPNFPGWLPRELGGQEISQDAYLNLWGDQLDARQQAERDAALYGYQTERDRFGLGADWLLEGLRNKNARDLLSLRADLNPPDPMEGYTATQINLTVQRAITPQERQIWGDRFAKDTELATADLLRQGYPLGPETIMVAKDIAREIGGGKPDLSFGMNRVELPGQGGAWYDPRVQMVGEQEVVEPRWGPLRDKRTMVPAITPIMDPALMPSKDRLAAMATPMTDSTFVVKNIKPALERGALRPEDLEAATELGLTADELNRILGLVRNAQPDSTQASVPEGF